MLLIQNISEDRQMFLQRIMILSYRKMTYLDEILRLTKEIGENLDRDDRVSVQLLLVARQEEIEKLDECRVELHEEVSLLEGDELLEMETILKGQLDNTTPEEEEAMKEKGILAHLGKINAYSKTSKRHLEELVLLDRRMSSRVAGDDSFYQAML